MTVLEWIRFIPGAALTISGLFFLVTAVIGNYRFSTVLYRMHAAGIGDTLGLLLLLAGLLRLLGCRLHRRLGGPVLSGIRHSNPFHRPLGKKSGTQCCR